MATTLLNHASTLVLFLWIGPLIFAMLQFSFLFKKEAAEKVFAQPRGKLSLYTSRITSSLLWPGLVTGLTIIGIVIFAGVQGATNIIPEAVMLFGMAVPVLLFSVSVGIFSAVVSRSWPVSIVIAIAIVAIPPLAKRYVTLWVSQLLPAVFPTQADVPLLGINMYYTIIDIYLYAGETLGYWFRLELQDLLYTLAYATFFFVAAAWVFLRKRTPAN